MTYGRFGSVFLNTASRKWTAILLNVLSVSQSNATVLAGEPSQRFIDQFFSYAEQPGSFGANLSVARTSLAHYIEISLGSLRLLLRAVSARPGKAGLTLLFRSTLAALG